MQPTEQNNLINKPSKNTKTIITLLSLNAVLILLVSVGILVMNNTNSKNASTENHSDFIEDQNQNPDTESSFEDSTKYDNYFLALGRQIDTSITVPDSELWNKTTIQIYSTPDIDICINSNLSDLGEIYWQTSNPDIIAGFYDSARSWLGYDSSSCKTPVIKSAGTATITAGTRDGKRKDSLQVTVIDPPIDEWRKEVLSLVNGIRTKNGLSRLAWGDTCEEAAMVRANEIVESYSHTRPDDSSWDTACPVPTGGGVSGENLAMGSAAVSPEAVVSLWMESETHKANILSPNYTKLAVGFVFDPSSKHRTYWSQIFTDY